MKEEYKIGSLSKVIQQASKLKGKTSSDGELCKLAELFAPPVKNICSKESVSVLSRTQDDGGRKQNDKLKKTSSSTKKRKLETCEELKDQTGYDPPPGIVHESLINRHDENDEKGKPSGRKPRHKNRRDRTKDPRTIFVGNLPIAFDKKQLKKLFLPFGAIESLRFRCAPPADLKLPKRAIAITKTFHKDRHNIISYVCYEKEESAQKALKLNGKEVDGFHIRVDISNNAKKHDKTNTVFIGNLTYDITENELWDHFQDCGEIENVRVIRDSKTGMGKGFGYIKFQEKDSVQFALKLHESSLNGRKVRVMRCDAKTALKKKEKMLNKIQPKTGQDKSSGKKMSFRSTNKKADPFHNKQLEKKKRFKEGRSNNKRPSFIDSSASKKGKKVKTKYRMKNKK